MASPFPAQEANLKFRYIGDYPAGKTVCEAFGCVFTLGAEIEVPQQFQSKALGNRFFEPIVEEAEIIEDDKIADGNSDAEINVPAKDEADTSDPGDDYNPFQGMDKSGLIAMAKDRGVEIDGRWSFDKIAQALKDADNG